MALQVNIVSIEPVGPNLRVIFNVGVTGSYVSGGDTLDFTKALKDPSFIGIAEQIIASQGPLSLDVWSQGGNVADAIFPIRGAALNNSKVKFASSFGGELAAGAYPAGITGDTIGGEAVFAKLL